MSHERCEIDLTACLHQARQGDESAARELFRHFLPMVARIVRAHRPARDDDSDLIQETFLRVFRHLGRLDGPEKMEHWVARITTNVCRSRARLWRRRPELRFTDLPESQQASMLASLGSETESAAYDVDNHELLERLLQQLPPADRALVVLLDLDQLPPAEAARQLGCSRGALAVRAFRARQRLKAIWQQLNRSRP